MATVTPNFNWPVPTSTDLVKDGATAIEALGDSIDASLVDLKGGTTGQVLSKNSNTDMDFTWVTDAAGDITGVTAGTGISGGGTSGTVTVTNSMATAITTAGDTLYGTGAGTFSRLGIGTAGQVLTVNSGATAPEWTTAAAGSTFVGCAAFRNSGTQSIPSGTTTALTLPSEEYDSDAFHSTSTNTSRFTIPAGKGGKYLVNAFVQGATNLGALQQLIFLVNGSTYSSNGYNGGVFADQRYTADWVAGYSSVISLVAADYLEVALYHLAGSAQNVQNVRVSITYLGA